MKKELKYFNIEKHYGGNQNWFWDPMMRLGGCAAVTACDLCIYLNILNNKHLYPFDINLLKKSDYIKFSKVMKPYLRPRMSGINTLQLYIDGFSKYLTDMNEKTIRMRPFNGKNSVNDAENAIINQIDKNIPIPFLLLKHKNRKLSSLVWHWFLIVGYEKTNDDFLVKIATYGEYNWISFYELWNTGYEEKGGMIIINLQDEQLYKNNFRTYQNAVKTSAQRLLPLVCYYHKDSQPDKLSGYAPPLRGVLAYTKPTRGCKLNDFGIIETDYNFGDESSYYI